MPVITDSFRQNRYLRSNAVKYAVTYALHPNPAFRYFPLVNDSSGDCANFLSQCLLAGGGKMDFNPSRPWWYNKNGTASTSDDTWSIPWTVAHSLYYYLRVNQEENRPYTQGLEIQSARGLELGDLIFYEDNTGLIFHSTIVTAFSGGEPLVSHHSFEALNIPYRSSWPAVKYHYIKVSM
ncbi:MAG: amidase domain-containing protein [Bacillota bacterium]|nr:amidase domain-containing protein [Bacillota bacterium]